MDKKKICIIVTIIIVIFVILCSYYCYKQKQTVSKEGLTFEEVKQKVRQMKNNIYSLI